MLDQGCWREGLLTAPSDEALKNDILLAKSMGFNGCRKHQKSEDPRFLYWADRLGYLVWEEFGGVSFRTKGNRDWGYTVVHDEDEMVETYARMIEAIRESEILSGYCYTQLTDVEQEVNGFFTYDREQKVSPEAIRVLNDSVTSLGLLRGEK